MMPFGMIAAQDWTTFLWWIDVIVKVAAGLGAVIFVHELGHFLVAKACGVKCEKFMIGFDIGGYKLSRRWGETEYGIGILPLGGYVKMLGQDDDPSHINEQMQKSQINAASPDAVPISGPNGETYYVDRRSYLAKSVPQRMAIISAGVTMNIIFAFIFATVAYGMGVPYMPCIVSETMPGSPAWRAAIEPGDEIVRIGEVENPTFTQLRGDVTLGDTENGITTVVRRAVDNDLVTLTLKPQQEPGELATIGIISPMSLRLWKYKTESGEYKSVLEGSPADRATLVRPEGDPARGDDTAFETGDQIIRVAAEPVTSYREFAAVLAKQPDRALEVTVKRTPPGFNKALGDDSRQRPGEGAAEMAPDGLPQDADASRGAKELTFSVPAQPLRDFGLAMKMGPIVAVQPDSPAAAAGLAVGDTIETVDGRPAGADGNGDVAWTPDRLPDYLRQAAIERREVELVVTRKAKPNDAAQQVTVRVMPRAPMMYYSAIPAGAPQGVEALGIAYRIENEIGSVLPNGPAENHGFAPGDRIVAAKVAVPDNDQERPVKSETIVLGPDHPNWASLMHALQSLPVETAVEFTIAARDQTQERRISIQPSPVAGRYVAPRGFVFEPLERTRTADSFTQQVQYGWDETVEALTMVFRFLQKLGTQVPITMLGGPGTIAVAAGGAASQGISSLLVFLTMLSANLAVINFLPIPLLDGGHIVFLAYEGLRGRPANEKVVVGLHLAGFAFIITLMLFVIGLDIQRWLFT